MADTTEFVGELVQDNMVVAAASSTSFDAVLREIVHYARQYLNDGPIEIRLRKEDG